MEVDPLVEHRCRDFDMDRNVIPGDGVVCGHGTIGGKDSVLLCSRFYSIRWLSRRDAWSEDLQNS